MSHRLKIIYMGTPDFAVLPLKKIVEAGHNIIAVITNPDKPAGRGQKLQESAVKLYAREAGLKILQPEKFRDETFLKQLAELKADLQIVVAFKMLPEIVWNMPPLGTVNLHASLLPDYRGAAPINWAILNGEKQSGVTTFLLKHEIDTGSILLSQKIDIGETTTAGQLHDALMTVGADLLLKTVDAIEQKNYTLTEQQTHIDGTPPHQAPKIFKENMKIDWHAGLERIYNHIRGLSPFPTAWTELKNKQTGETLSLKIYAAEKHEQQHTQKIGYLLTDGKNTLEVRVGGGTIRITDVQLAGKKRMQIKDFLRGFPISDYELHC